MKPFYEILKSNANLKWPKECKGVFIVAKRAFKADVCLTFYNADFQLVVATDAVMDGFSTVLSYIMLNGFEITINLFRIY